MNSAWLRYAFCRLKETASPSLNHACAVSLSDFGIVVCWLSSAFESSWRRNSSKLKEGNFSLEEFLRHELSNALLSQHTTIPKSLKLTAQAWFSEGLAVSFSRQKAYLSQAEFIQRALKTG